MQRARAAERHQRVVARIMPALHRDDADGLGHVGGDDRDDALRRLHQPEAKLVRKLSDGILRKVVTHRHAAAQ